MSAFDEAFVLDLRIQFCGEADQTLQTLENLLIQIERQPDPQKLIEMKRSLHNFKGSSRAVGFANLSKLAHELETWCEDGSMASRVDRVLPLLDAVKAAMNAFLESKDASGLIDFVWDLA